MAAAHLTAISYAYPAVPGDARAGIAAALTRRHDEVPPGVFVLSTCLRTEVVVDGGDDRLDKALVALFGEVPEVEGAQRWGDLDAVTHLFRVAAGLESPVRGESEILTQVRQSVQPVKDRGEAGGMFVKLLEAAVASGRASRELFPVSPHHSLAAIAAQVIGYPSEVAVLGNGAIAAAAVDALLSLPVRPKITIVARTPGKLVRPGVDEWTFDRAGEALTRFPAVISATSAKQRLVDDTELADLLVARTEPLILVDMAMPPDFRPAEGSPVTYVDIDHLAALASRWPADDGADEIVAKRAEEAFHRYAGHHRIGPVIEQLMATADDVVEHTVSRFAGKLSEPADETLLQQTAHTVARKLLAGPLGYLNRARTPGDVEAIVEAFQIDGDG